MKLIKSSLLIAAIAILMVLVAACGQQSSGTTPAKNSNNSGYSSGSNNNTPSNGSNTNASGGYSNSDTSSNNGAYSNSDTSSNNSGYSNSDTSGSAGLIHTATAQVKGTATSILTDGQNRTLYYFTPDTATASKCIGACEKKWPALLASASASPSSTSALPGSLTAAITGNGQQVSYNGHFLYTFAGDHAPGDTNGEGVGGKWFVATPDLK